MMLEHEGQGKLGTDLASGAKNPRSFNKRTLQISVASVLLH